MENGARQEGVVWQWSERGYGFIHFADGSRAYVHNSQCGGEHLIQGERVLVSLAQDPRNPGKLQATNVERLGNDACSGAAPPRFASDVAPPAQTPPLMTSGPRHVFAPSAPVPAKPDPTEALLDALRRVDPQPGGALDALVAAGSGCSVPPGGVEEALRVEGLVTSWSDRGFGFIDIADGRRAYVHTSQCGGQHLREGETVSARVLPDAKNPGKLAAFDVLRGPSRLSGEDGTVVEWKEDGGYGFVLMDDDRRAYVHRSALGGAGSLRIGQRLRVIVQPDARNPGKFMIAEVKGELFEEAPALGRPGPAGGSDQFHPQAAAAAGRQQQVDCMGEQVDATVAEWRDDGGYGFVNLDDGRRAYIHRSSFGGQPGHNLALGMRLRLTVRPDTRNPGKLCVSEVAGELTSVGGAGQPTGAPACGSSEVAGEAGTVSEWKDEGGYGFLTMDDGRRVYIHRSSFGGSGSLTVTQRLQVTTKADPRNPGKWCVGVVLALDGVPPGSMPQGGRFPEPDAKRARLIAP